jgi:conjugal transfer pilus assembly protein TraB
MSKSKQIHRKQKNVLYVCYSVIFIVVISMTGFSFDFVRRSESASLEPSKVDLPVDKLDSQEVRMSQVEAQGELMSQKLQFLEKALMESQRKAEKQKKEKGQLHHEISSLKEELRRGQESPVPQEVVGPVAVASKSKGKDPFIARNAFQEQPSSLGSGARKFPLKEMVMGEPSQNLKHVDNEIPAGTTVRAVMVSSVDAPCGAYSSSDPQPVKLRLLDSAHLPKSVRVKLKGGLVIASAYGDLSSERVYIRVERLMQNRADGNFVETGITGFVTGEDGKYGVRGVVADRSEKMITSAAFSGFISGVNQFLQSTINAQNISEATKGQPNDLKWDILKRGGAQGGTNALDKLAEYYIKRAEQLLPVIQVASGRTVDITFTHGAEVGDLHTKEKVNSIRKKTEEGRDV